jgi:hypothetical protein
MSKPLPEQNGKSRLLPLLAGLFFLAWAVAVFFAVRDTFFNDRQRSEPAGGGAIVALADRGKGRFPILDRGGRELAVSFPSKSVYARPLEVEHPDAVALFLARELGISERELKRDLKEERSFVWLGRQISETAVNNIQARKLRGIYVVDESQRFYPQGGMAAQLLGVAREGRGLTGIEAQYDQQLQTVVDLADEKGPPRGPLLLTLDLRIQELLEQELAQLAGETGATGGEGIVVDPRTGEVLALANLPAFEPNFFGDSDENSRINRVLNLALPASGFGQLLRMAASPQPVPVEIPVAVAVSKPPKRDRLAALKKELRKSNPAPATFGGGPGRLVAFKGGYRSPGLAGLGKISEPPGFSTILTDLGVGQKLVMELPVGVVSKATIGETPPTFWATGGELLTALTRLLSQDGTTVPRVVVGVADPQSGRIQAPEKPEGSSNQAAAPPSQLRDYLARLAGADGSVLLEELTEVPAPVKETAAVVEAVVEDNGREVGQIWEPGQSTPATQGTGEKNAGVSPEKSGTSFTGAAGLGGFSPGQAGVKDAGKSNLEKAKEEPRHFISLLVALPCGGQVSEVVLLLAMEGAVLDPAKPSPVRLAAERMLPQMRIWAAENIGSPATLAWTANESLWRTQWQKAQAGRDEKFSLTSRSNRRLMPDLQGASLRKALQVLNQRNLRVRIQGVGRVVEQRPEAGAPISGDECVLILSGLNLINIRPARELAVGVESGSDKLKIFSSISNPRPAAGPGN